MKNIEFTQHKIYTLTELGRIIEGWRLKGKTFAFTNGCFDILHVGHIASLNEAAKNADFLVVAINADKSVQNIKGAGRPINNEKDRAAIIASLLVVDAILLFEEDTPLEAIKSLLPDVLVKGGDYTIDQIVGAKEVQANGGKVVINPILAGYSSTATLAKLKAE